MQERTRLLRRIRGLLVAFVVALALSGLTAFPLRWELGLAVELIGPGSSLGELWPALADWSGLVHRGLEETGQRYPFVAYGTDWLAFAHLVIAALFWGPLRDPVRNRWVVDWGLLACAGVLPLALICGPLRDIPLFWRLVDCSFGVFGALPLLLVRRDIRTLEQLGETPP